jgi:hypothetical protein
MSRIIDAVKGSSTTLLTWLVRYIGWLFTTAMLTIGGSMVLMLFKD